MSSNRPRTEQPTESQHANDTDSPSAPVAISNVDEDDMSDMEHQAGSDARLLGGQSSSAPPSNWRNLASLSFSVLGGDTVWHQPRADRNR